MEPVGDDKESSEEDESETELPPRPSPDELDTIRFSVPELRSKAPLSITLSDGPITASYAPAILLGRIAEQAARLISDLGAGAQPMLYGMVPGNSMTLFIGDPNSVESQEQLPYEATFQAAMQVSKLIRSDGDSLFDLAVQIGPPVRVYDDLARIVHSEGVTLSWRPRAEEVAQLTPDRAGEQHARLNVEPEMKAHEVTVNGWLYRVITAPGQPSGTIGIKLFDWSSRPPHVKDSLIVHYRGHDLQDSIKGGLLGEPVKAQLSVRQPTHGESIERDRFELELVGIDRGPGEHSGLGIPIEDFDPDEPE